MIEYRGLKIKEGDVLEIHVCGPNAFNTKGVTHKGKVVFDDAAYCLDVSGKLFTLRSYVRSVKVKKCT